MKPPSPTQNRKLRMSQALRANLAKRKSQQRERQEEQSSHLARPEHLSLSQLKRSLHVNSARPLDS